VVLDDAIKKVWLKPNIPANSSFCPENMLFLAILSRFFNELCAFRATHALAECTFPVMSLPGGFRRSLYDGTGSGLF
jgi:hypothetical protein